jgi:hypothetical protein
MDIAHALVTGFLVFGIYAGAEKAGILDGKSLGMKLAIMLPIYFVVIFVFNIIWPYSG